MNMAFRHSGRLGDILYSMPLVRQMARIQGGRIDYYVCSDAAARLGKDVFHPSLDLMVNTALFGYVEPLLSIQDYIKNIVYTPSCDIPSYAVDLDQFKTSGLNLKAGLISGWYRKAFGLSFPLEKAWLDFDEAALNDEYRIDRFRVLISRTTRFCNTRINYSFLDQIEGVGFIGMPYEYEDFIGRHALKNVRHVMVRDALELGILMRRADIFIGNQSSNFAIAEGLKVPRALEAFEPVPVASPVGGVCFEYINTKFLVGFLSEILNMHLDVPEDVSTGDYCESIKVQDGYIPPIKQRFKNFLGITKKPGF